MGADNGLRLRESAVFEGMSADVVDTLSSRGKVQSFDADCVLFDRGQDADRLMILQEGVIELLFPIQILGVERPVVMENKQAGDVVAWSALVSPYRFMLSARCASKCTLMCFTREVLHTFFEENPLAGYRFMRNLAGVIGRRLQSMQMVWMNDLQATTARQLE